MNGYERLVTLFRDQGAYKNDIPPGIGAYKDGKVEFQGHKLEKRSLLVSSHLIFDDTRYWTYRNNNKESALYLDERDIIKEGDLLAMFYNKEKNKFVILAKVVSP